MAAATRQHRRLVSIGVGIGVLCGLGYGGGAGLVQRERAVGVIAGLVCCGIVWLSLFSGVGFALLIRRRARAAFAAAWIRAFMWLHLPWLTSAPLALLTWMISLALRFTTVSTDAASGVIVMTELAIVGCCAIGGGVMWALCWSHGVDACGIKRTGIYLVYSVLAVLIAIGACGMGILGVACGVEPFFPLFRM